MYLYRQVWKMIIECGWIVIDLWKKNVMNNSNTSLILNIKCISKRVCLKELYDQIWNRILLI